MVDRKSSPPKASGPAIHVFVDVDNTLVSGASIYMFAIEAWKSGFIRWHNVIPALFHQRHFIRSGETAKRVKSTRERAQALVAGQSVDDFTRVGESAWRRAIAPKVFPDVLAILQDHEAKGHHVWLVTASPQVLAQVIARDLRLHGAIGTILEIKDGRFTGEIEGELLHGPLKAEAVRRHVAVNGVDLKNCFAYSDSIADAPLLDMVGNPVAVNPDSALLSHAAELGWPIFWPEGTDRHQKKRTKNGREKR